MSTSEVLVVALLPRYTPIARVVEAVVLYTPLATMWNTLPGTQKLAGIEAVVLKAGQAVVQVLTAVEAAVLVVMVPPIQLSQAPF